MLTGIQILRAVHKIADHSVVKPRTKKVDPFLVIAMVCTMINSALRINMSVLEACLWHRRGLTFLCQLHLSRCLWYPLHVHRPPSLDPSRYHLHPPICGICHLCCLPRRTLASLSRSWDRKITISHQPLCSGVSGRHSLLRWRVYRNTIHPG